MNKEIKTKKDLLVALSVLPIKNKAQRNEIVCALIGHSRIQTMCFGYYNCGRCGAQLGDNLGSIYSAANSVVVIGHNCKICKKNYKLCTWRDKIFVSNPFKKEAK